MPALAATVLNPQSRDLPALIFAPPLGTSASVWAGVAYHFADDYNVLLLELPGHGRDAARAESLPSDFTVEDIAQGVIEAADALNIDVFHFAGCSISGGVGLVLGASHAHRLASLSVLCAGPAFGTAEMWAQRIADVEESTTASLIPDTADRWFAAGFLDEDIATGPIVLEMLRATHDQAYIACARALSTFDVRDAVPSISTPTLFLAGAQDTGNTPDDMRELAGQVEGSTFAVIPDSAHLCFVEHPEIVAERLQRHLAANESESSTQGVHA